MRKVLGILVVGGAILVLAWPDSAPDAGRPGAPTPLPESAIPVPGSSLADLPDASPRAEAPSDPVSGAVVLLVSGPDGRPVPRAEARLWVTGSEGRHRRRVEIRDGRGVHSFEDAGITELRIEVYGAEGCGPILTDPIPATPQVVEVRLPEPLAISGVVLDEKEMPVPGVRIEARTAYSEFRTGLEHNNRPHSSAVSREDGTFRIGGLGDRNYHLSMSAPKGLVPRNRRETFRGGSEGVRLACQRLVTIALRVVGPDGRPVVGAEVCLRTYRIGNIRETDAEGWARFPEFDPGRVRQVEVEPPDDREDVLPRIFLEGLPEDPVIRLEPALPLAGIVRDTDGDIVPGALIGWYPQGEPASERSAEADENGRFRVPRVPVGKIVVFAAAPGDAAKLLRHDVQTVAAGREDLELTVRKTPTIVLRFADWEEGEIGCASVRVPGHYFFSSQSSRLDARGTLRCAGLETTDVASIFVRTDRGRVWVGHGIRPKSEVQVVRGLVSSKITGRLVGMPEKAKLAVVAHVLWDIEIRGTIEPDGRFEIGGVPPGTWRVEVYPTHAGANFRGEVEAPAGADVEIHNTAR